MFLFPLPVFSFSVSASRYSVFYFRFRYPVFLFPLPVSSVFISASVITGIITCKAAVVFVDIFLPLSVKYFRFVLPARVPVE